MVKILCLIILASALSACGSLSTLPKSDEAIAENLKEHETRCTFLPQIYSGAAYDICRLNAEYKENTSRPRYPDNENRYPKGDPIDQSQEQYRRHQDGKSFAFLLVADFALSGLIDTLALPYTIYKQSRDGSIVLN